MTDDPALARPLGWWLKEADARLDAAFDRALQGEGTDRRGWQVLASLARTESSADGLAASLASFDPPAAVHVVVEALEAKGWVEEAGGLLRLTPEGARRHAALAPLVEGVRQQVSAALPREDYVLLVRLLARLVEGL